MVSPLTITTTQLGGYYCACFMVSEPKINVKTLNQGHAGDEAGPESSERNMVVLFFWDAYGPKLLLFYFIFKINSEIIKDKGKSVCGMILQ